MKRLFWRKKFLGIYIYTVLIYLFIYVYAFTLVVFTFFWGPCVNCRIMTCKYVLRKLRIEKIIRRTKSLSRMVSSNIHEILTPYRDHIISISLSLSLYFCLSKFDVNLHLLEFTLNDKKICNSNKKKIFLFFQHFSLFENQKSKIKVQKNLTYMRDNKVDLYDRASNDNNNWQ